jgi:hypothetical protein
VVDGLPAAGNVNVIVDVATVGTGVTNSACVEGVCSALGGYVTVKSGSVNLEFRIEGWDHELRTISIPDFELAGVFAKSFKTIKPPKLGFAVERMCVAISSGTTSRVSVFLDRHRATRPLLIFEYYGLPCRQT